MKKKGVVLVSFGNRSYAQMAWNMLKSIQATSAGVVVELLYEPSTFPLNLLKDFDNPIPIPKPLLYPEGRLSPCSAKVFMHDLVTLDHYLYLDIDGICIADLNPIINALSKKRGSVFTQVMRTAKKDTDGEIFWMKKDDIFREWDLEPCDIHGLQSSWMFFKNTNAGRDFIFTAQDVFEKRPSNELLLHSWGGKKSGRDDFPDELIYTVACAIKGIDPSVELDFIVFPKGQVRLSQMEGKAILSMWGTRWMPHRSAKRIYDLLMQKYLKPQGLQHRFKFHLLERGKHANGKQAMGYKK